MLLSGCALLSGFPDRLILSGQSVTKDRVAAVLAQADPTFQQAARQQYAATNDESRCYIGFIDQKHTNGGEQLWCGPVRLYGIPASQRWANLAVSADTAGGLRLDSTHPSIQPQTLPTQLTFARPDGQQPATGDDLDPPTPPTEQPGIVTAVDSNELGAVTIHPPKDNGLLLGPTTALKIAGIGSSSVYGLGSQAHSAASGEQFLAIQFAPMPAITTALSTTTDPGRLASVYLSGPTQTIVVGAARHPVGNIPTDGTKTLIVSVPKGVPVRFEVTDEGRPLSYDLRQATRAPLPEEQPLYRAQNTTPLNRRITGTLTPTAGDDRTPIQFHITAENAVLTPWDEDKKWAPAGKVWLAVNVPNYSIDNATFDIPQFGADAFQFTLAGGQPVNAIQVGTSVWPDRLLAAVPPDTTTATLTCRWTATLTFGDDRPARPSPPQTLPISIPAS
ncbi:hypothetical protein GCM10009765_23800 [Fodinicola feengrottensis]|uniref:Uncharacterized protein n=1 Tax=Fodinicola feengrottensis TaxID=435914 RepID=A0ABP4SIT9_9ACTN